ncbi:filamentous hemagglutinin [Brasilonema sp. UFV-L1]|uniref:filamentous hemagglutinin n=1 Tax=Brasilonema sp. UFV-L1 TaxID=2234130 RepID=UPI00145F3584|nr:filamentous hemagglutinin [Brasilonema sp. UFV-L1]NMG07139.1 filamentous hemagglutinin [Brasilonema sp. UFV-L1]
MVKKTFTLGLIAAAVMVMPTVAFAGEGVTKQEINQNASVGGENSRVNQKADQYSTQKKAGYPNSGRQNTNQRIDQNGAAIDNSVVDQYASQRSEQLQRNRQQYKGPRYSR